MRLDTETVETIETVNEDLVTVQVPGNCPEVEVELSIFDSDGRIAIAYLDEDNTLELIDLLNEYV